MSSRSWVWVKLFGWVVVLAAGVWVLSVILVVVWARLDRARPADAVVVLGAAQYAGKPSPVLKARLDHAVALWRRGIAPTLVVTGGTGAGDWTSEAAVSRQYALKRGVPDSAILVENEGRTTSASLRSVARMLRERRQQRVVLVSDPFHMLRLHVLAVRYGLTPYTSPTATSPIAANREQYVHYILSESLKVPLVMLIEW